MCEMFVESFALSFEYERRNVQDNNNTVDIYFWFDQHATQANNVYRLIDFDEHKIWDLNCKLHLLYFVVELALIKYLAKHYFSVAVMYKRVLAAKCVPTEPMHEDRLLFN